MSLSTVTAPDLGTRQSQFVNHWLPVLERRFSYRFRSMPPEARQEATADCIATAWRRFQDAGDHAWDGQSDRTRTATPSKVADFIASSYVGEGREFLGTMTTDAMAPACRKAGRSHVRTIHRRRCGADGDASDTGVLPEALVSSSAGPLTRFRARSDWSTIAARCTPQVRKVLTLLARGFKPVEIARKILVSPARITALKYQLAETASSLGYGPTRWQVA